MRKFAVKAALAGVMALIIVGAGSAATYRGIEPIVISGNPGCANVPGLTYTTEVTFNPTLNGSSSNGVYIFLDSSNTLGWYTLGDVIVKAVIVKGGPNANVYIYPGGDFSDGGLVPPVNPKNGKLYGFGYSTFCI